MNHISKACNTGGLTVNNPERKLENSYFTLVEFTIHDTSRQTKYMQIIDFSGQRKSERNDLNREKKNGFVDFCSKYLLHFRVHNFQNVFDKYFLFNM